MEYITHFVPNADVIGAYDQDTIHMKLKNGQVLCQLMNGLVPGSIKKINTNNMAFKQMENIGMHIGNTFTICLRKICLIAKSSKYS